MNRHDRRAEMKILAANDRFAETVGRNAFGTWASLRGFTGEDIHERLMEAMQSNDDWRRAEDAVVADAAMQVAATLRSGDLRITERERERMILMASMAAIGHLRSMAEGFAAYCATMAAIGRELQPDVESRHERPGGK